METTKPLNKISFNAIFSAFNKAFEDYEMQLNKDELHTMLWRRGFVPELSFGAYENEKLIAFTLNGIGFYNNIKTAYDTGTGTLKEYRGQGLATKIFKHSIPFLKKANVTRYLLEVLQHNSKAVSVYKNLGFEVSREFNYFVKETDKIELNINVFDPSYQIEQLDLSKSESMVKFWDFIPSWQNSLEAISRKIDDFRIIGVYKNGNLVGYSIFEPNSGDITQIAVDKNFRRKGIALILLKEILKTNRHNSIKVINTEVSCSSITEFLQSNSISLEGKQFEMTKQL